MEIEVSYNLKLLRRDVKYGRVKPQAITINGKPLKTANEVYDIIDKLEAQGETSIPATWSDE